MQIDMEPKLDFDDVLLVPQRSKTASRKVIDLSREFKFYHSPRVWNQVPLIAANMYNTGSIRMAMELAKKGCITCLHKHHDPDDLINFWFSSAIQDFTADLVWISTGIKEDSILNKFKSNNIQPNICIDVANGYTQDFVDHCARVRENFPDSIIMAGNVCTPEMVQELILHGGVDIVKCGVGGGSLCNSRLQAGIGFPQLSCVIECSHVAHGLKSGDRRLGLVCSDGGCKLAGDVCKSFAAGADFTMCGGLFMSCDENDGEWTYQTSFGDMVTKYTPKDLTRKKHSLLCYGMSSYEAQKRHNGGVKEYRGSEGKVRQIPYKGPVKYVLQDILGGMRSCGAYLGATCLKDFSKCAKFIRVNRVHRDMTI